MGELSLPTEGAHWARARVGTGHLHDIESSQWDATLEPRPPSQELCLSKELGPGTSVGSQSGVAVEV